jgi:hypothetical protein
VDIRDLRDAAVEHRASRRAATAGRRGKPTADRLCTLNRDPVVCHEVEKSTIEPVDEAELCLAEARSVPGDGVEYRLDVGRRGRDDPKDLAGRGLLL